MRQIAAVVLSTLFFTTGAHADPISGDHARATAAQLKGNRLAARHDQAGACAKYEESHALWPRPASFLSVARCHARAGRTTDAYGEFQQALEGAQRDHEKKVAAAAKAEISKLEPKIGRLSIGLTPDASMDGLSVSRNGEPVESAALGTPSVVAPGTYDVSATAPDHEPWHTAVTVSAGQSATVSVPKLTPTSRPMVVAASIDSPPPPEEPEDKLPSKPSSNRIGLTPTIQSMVALRNDGAGAMTMLLVSYDITPAWRAYVRSGAIEDAPDTGPSAFVLSNPTVGSSYSFDLGNNFALVPSLAVVAPVGQGGGNTPDPAVASAAKTGRFIDDGSTFDPNYLGVNPGLQLGFSPPHFRFYAFDQLRTSFRTRGSAVSPDATKVRDFPKVHAGYFIVKELEVYGEWAYVRYLSSPALLKADPTAVQFMWVGGGLAGDLGMLQLSVTYYRAILDNPMGRDGYNLFLTQLSLRV